MTLANPLYLASLSALLLACPGAPAFPQLDPVAGSCEAHWSSAARPLAAVPDTNADGVTDVLTTSTDDQGQARVSLLSGANGAVLWTREASRQVNRAQLEDLDGDGTAELLLGTMVPADQANCGENCGSSGGLPQFHLDAVSVSDGSSRWSRSPESALPLLNDTFVVVADEDGDSVRELILGAHYTDDLDPTPLQVVSGATGAVLRTLAPPADSAESFGERLVVVPDLDGDGRPDLLVTDTRGPYSHYAAGRLTALSSGTGALIWERSGQMIEGALLYGEGLSLLSRPDGFPEVIVGAHNSSAPEQDGVPGVAEVLNAQTGAPRLLLTGRRPDEHFGQFVSDVGDVNGDGVADIGVGSPVPGLPVIQMGMGGRFSVHSGVDGAVLLDIEEKIPGDKLSNYFGSTVLGLRDRNDQNQSTLVVESTEKDGETHHPVTLAFRCTP